MNFGHKQSGRNCGGFTLVELLAVIAIMVILLVVAMPSFESFTRRSLSTPIADLASTIRLARQYAITHRQWVWVVFPDQLRTTYTGGNVDMALRSYAVIAGHGGKGTNYVTEWKLMPKGIYFDGDPAKAGLNSVFDSYSNGADTQFPFPSDVDNDRNLPAILFKPDGRAYTFDRSSQQWDSGSVVHIPVTEAVVEVNTNSGSIVSVSTVGSTNLIVRLRKLTGQLDFPGQ